MATKKRSHYREPSGDSLTWTKEDRRAMRQSRANNQSSRYQREVAIEKAHAAARPQEPTK